MMNAFEINHNLKEGIWVIMREGTREQRLEKKLEDFQVKFRSCWLEDRNGNSYTDPKFVLIKGSSHEPYLMRFSGYHACVF